MLSASNIHYDIDGRNKGIANGGIGIIHQLTGKSGLLTKLMSVSSYPSAICLIMNQIMCLILPTTSLLADIAWRTLNY
jgi:hypothetical protein